MNILSNTKSIDDSFNLLGKLIGDFVEILKQDEKANQQKILEVCHAGKFLLFFDNKIVIEELSEQPDFILNKNGLKIGLEHQIIIKSESKKREGYFQNLFSLVEHELQQENKLPNFLANCYISPYAPYKINDKKNIVLTIKNIITHFVLYNELIENTLIINIFKSPHSQITVNANFGAWWVNEITEKPIVDAVNIKNQKILKYKKLDEQWLLLVIGSLGESSYEMDKTLTIELDTKFDKVFILEDFKNQLYQLK